MKATVSWQECIRQDEFGYWIEFREVARQQIDWTPNQPMTITMPPELAKAGRLIRYVLSVPDSRPFAELSKHTTDQE